MKTRIEADSMGQLEVPEDALYGAQTQRAINNFPISGQPLPESFIRALIQLKQAEDVLTFLKYHFFRVQFCRTSKACNFAIRHPADQQRDQHYQSDSNFLSLGGDLVGRIATYL